MITTDFAKVFAYSWIDAWNTHNLDEILSHYADDFVIETPMAAKLLPESGGSIKGKEAVRAYWKVGLERIPDLKFEIIDVLLGVHGLSIYYINTATHKKSVELMCFNAEGKVNMAFVHYSE